MQTLTTDGDGVGSMFSDIGNPSEAGSWEQRLADNFPRLLVPVHETLEANERICLFSGDLELLRGSASCRGVGSVYLEWLPSPLLGHPRGSAHDQS